MSPQTKFYAVQEEVVFFHLIEITFFPTLLHGLEADTGSFDLARLKLINTTSSDITKKCCTVSNLKTICKLINVKKVIFSNKCSKHLE